MAKHQATIKEIAQKLSISISTVSRALQNHPRIGLRTREKVNDLAKKLNYTPNPAALSLKKNTTRNIGVILPNLQEEFFSLSITAIEDIVSDKGYNVFISQSRDTLAKEEKAIKSFINSRVDGIIASISAETYQYRHFKELESFGIPIVFFDRTPKVFPCFKVRSNVMDGAFAAVEFLAQKGARHIALLNGPAFLEISDERQQGYLSAIKQLGLSTTPAYVKSTDLSTEDTSKKMLDLLALPQPPDAVLAFNDYVALDAMRACKQKGILPNSEVLFASFANLPITTYMDNPPIASVEQFAYQMGEKAAHLLINVMENSHQDDAEPLSFEEIIVHTQLIVH
jgi:DNA-binding LacI/PurR family transcriptional regulator